MQTGFTSEKGRMQAILTSLVDVLIAVDMTGKIIQANRAAENLFLRREHNLLGQTLASLDAEIVHQDVMRVIANNQESHHECSIFLGSDQVFRINIVPIKGDDGEMEGALAVFHDITDARNFDQMRSDFVANVSHELRTPLTSIKGFVETLLDGALEDKLLCRRFLTIIDNETNRLTRLIEDLLNISALENNEIRVSLQKLNLVDMVKSVFNVLGPQATEKRLSLELVYSPGDCWVNGDEDLLGQMLINLIDNAIKYSSEDARVVVRIGREARGMAIKISDSGIGIAPESLPRLFERFYRVDKARSRILGGTGLGLAIVKHIAEQHGGEVFVESQLGVGSTFSVYLPAGEIRVAGSAIL